MIEIVRRKWGRWLASRGLPAPHIAALLDVDVETIAADQAIERPGPSPKLVPFLDVSPYRNCPAKRPILGPTGNKVRRLAALDYDAESIGFILMLDPSRVTDFLARVTPIRRRGRLSRPRSRDEQDGVLHAEARKRERAEARAARESWGNPRDVRSVVAPPVRSDVHAADDLAVELVVAVVAPPAPNQWTGPTKWYARGQSAGAAKLTEEDAVEIRRLRAEGMSTGAIAKQFKVARNTICYLLNGRTWRETPDDPPVLQRDRLSHEIDTLEL